MNKLIDLTKKGLNNEKITNVPFGDVIGHNNVKRKYFTEENNDIIYSRLKNEANVTYLPILGPCVDFGIGQDVLEENNDLFKYYSIDKACKFNYTEYDNIKDAVDRLIVEMNCLDEYDTLLLKKYFIQH